MVRPDGYATVTFHDAGGEALHTIRYGAGPTAAPGRSATSLPDALGGVVLVPATTFTTAAETALTIDPRAITLSMPDAQGAVAVRAPAGALPPARRCSSSTPPRARSCR